MNNPPCLCDLCGRSLQTDDGDSRCAECVEQQGARLVCRYYDCPNALRADAIQKHDDEQVTCPECRKALGLEVSNG